MCPKRSKMQRLPPSPAQFTSVSRVKMQCLLPARAQFTSVSRITILVETVRLPIIDSVPFIEFN